MACIRSCPARKCYGWRMTRPLRLEFPGALYHVTSRGDRQQAIYRDDSDRAIWLATLGHVCGRFNFVVHSYCQMTNHYHLLVQTVEGNLSQGMRQLNGLYTQRFNRRHELVGHLFQGRYHAVLVQKESHLLELSRYVVLNPVRGGLVQSPEQWGWSSHRCAIGLQPAPAWLDIEQTVGQFGSCRDDAVCAYLKFVMAGAACDSPLKHIRHRFVLGDEAFVERHTQPPAQRELRGLCKAQRGALAMSLADYQRMYPERDLAIASAFRSTAFTMGQLARFFGVSDKTVSRAVRKYEGAELG